MRLLCRLWVVVLGPMAVIRMVLACFESVLHSLRIVRQLLDAKANAWAISRGGSMPVNLLLRNCSADCVVTG